MKTYTATPADIKPEWYVVDARGKVLGRLAAGIARRLRGKHKPVTGNKARNKTYYRHSGYPGGIKSITFEKLIQSRPERVIEKAVKGMLPKGPLGRDMFRKLRVYADENHRHAAQQPKPLDL